MLVLSSKPFAHASEPWVVRAVEYRPVFEAQQPLQFRLRFSPMVTLATRRGERGALTNLVEHIRREDTSRRTLDDIVDEAARRWLMARAQSAGFALSEYACGNYQNASALQYRSGRRYLVPSIDVEGTLTVTDPGMFLATQLQGIGRARVMPVAACCWRNPSPPPRPDPRPNLASAACSAARFATAMSQAPASELFERLRRLDQSSCKVPHLVRCHRHAGLLALRLPLNEHPTGFG